MYFGCFWLCICVCVVAVCLFYICLLNCSCSLLHLRLQFVLIRCCYYYPNLDWHVHVHLAQTKQGDSNITPDALLETTLHMAIIRCKATIQYLLVNTYGICVTSLLKSCREFVISWPPKTDLMNHNNHIKHLGVCKL